MDIGLWMLLIIISLIVPSVIALILCLVLIKKKPYKKLSNKQIYAGFWFRLLAGLLDYIILAIISFILVFIPIMGGFLIYFFIGYILLYSTHQQNKLLLV